jgi:allantoate deiminase
MAMQHPESNRDPLSSTAIQEWIDELAQLTSEPDRLTRLALTDVMADALRLVGRWMEEAGMAVRFDGAGNVIGRYEGVEPGLPALMLGSHIDTVKDAGRFDGVLGVVTAIACVETLHRQGERLPFAIEVAAFGDEEGVRFGTGVVGSRVLAGLFDPRRLALHDADAIAGTEALLALGLDPSRVPEAEILPEKLLAYVELHIEQGPVLEEKGASLGCVTGITGAGRLLVTISGVAGHAGTVPMESRKDALTAAAECVLTVEAAGRRNGAVGTVGSFSIRPDAANVIPGEAHFSVDIRSLDNAARNKALNEVISGIQEIAARRGVKADITRLGNRDTIPCAPWLMAQIRQAIAKTEPLAVDLPSGAGHDGGSMSRITDIGMIFVRCRGGVSHNPEEYVSPEDIERGAAALFSFVTHFQPAQHRLSPAAPSEVEISNA